MIFEDIIKEARIVWARKGNTVVKKVRCTSGRRKGRLVSNASQCSAPPDIKKRITLNKTRRRMGPRMARRAQRTKRINPASRRVQSMNKARRR